MLVELGVVEQRYRAVLEVLEGAPVTEVARRYGVARQTVHGWLRRYAKQGGLGGWRTGRRGRRRVRIRCPVVEARVVAMRRAHPAWGPARIRWQLEREGVVRLPGRVECVSGAGPAPAGRSEEAATQAGGLPALGAGPVDGAVADGCDGPGAPGRRPGDEGGDRHR